MTIKKKILVVALAACGGGDCACDGVDPAPARDADVAATASRSSARWSAPVTLTTGLPASATISSHGPLSPE